jgi:hypothetical protein
MMKTTPFAIAVAAAMFALPVVANDGKQEQGRQEQKSDMQAQSAPARSTAPSADPAKSGESAAAGGSAAPQTEGHSASGAVISSERTAEPKSDSPAK